MPGWKPGPATSCCLLLVTLTQQLVVPLKEGVRGKSLPKGLSSLAVPIPIYSLIGGCFLGS